MKIAYIFHGHSRTWKQCYQNFFDNVYSVAPGDIFIHTWDKVSTSSGTYWNGWKDLEGEKLCIVNEYADISGIYNAYKPKLLKVEEHPIVDVSWCSYANIETKGQYGIKFMLYSSRNIFEEACKFGDYDYFVSTRLDIKYNSKLDLHEILQNQDYLIGPNHPNIDIFLLGSKKLMDIKTNYYHNIDKYWYHHPCFKNTGYDPVLQRYLVDNNITQIVKSNIRFELVRPFEVAHKVNF